MPESLTTATNYDESSCSQLRTCPTFGLPMATRVFNCDESFSSSSESLMPLSCSTPEYIPPVNLSASKSTAPKQSETPVYGFVSFYLL